MRYEVDVLVHHPLDGTARRFLDSVIGWANRVLRYRAEGDRMVVVVAVHSMDEGASWGRLYRKWQPLYPQERFEVAAEPRERMASTSK